MFESPDGKRGVVDLFEDRSQLILYHFMFGPGAGGWPDAGGPGCSMVVDNLGHPAHLHARDVSFVLVSSGRQETWEESPPDRPQSEPCQWWRRHDEY